MNLQELLKTTTFIELEPHICKHLDATKVKEYKALYEKLLTIEPQNDGLVLIVLVQLENEFEAGTFYYDLSGFDYMIGKPFELSVDKWEYLLGYSVGEKSVETYGKEFLLTLLLGEMADFKSDYEKLATRQMESKRNYLLNIELPIDPYYDKSVNYLLDLLWLETIYPGYSSGIENDLEKRIRKHIQAQNKLKYMEFL